MRKRRPLWKKTKKLNVCAGGGRMDLMIVCLVLNVLDKSSGERERERERIFYYCFSLSAFYILYILLCIPLTNSYQQMWPLFRFWVFPVFNLRTVSSGRLAHNRPLFFRACFFGKLDHIRCKRKHFGTVSHSGALSRRKGRDSIWSRTNRPVLKFSRLSNVRREETQQAEHYLNVWHVIFLLLFCNIWYFLYEVKPLMEKCLTKFLFF